MKSPLCSFGEAILWRTKRHAGNLNQWDREWSDGIFLGISGMGNSVLVGTSDGIFKTNDYRRSPDGRWHKQLIIDMQTTFQEYISPTPVVCPDVINIHAPIVGQNRVRGITYKRA